MDVRAFNYFIAVYEAESLSGAAKRCSVSQPTVSAAVAQLEQDLGASLFTRHSRGVTATPAARDLYPHACKVVGDLQAVRELFRAPAETASVRIGLMPFLSGQRVGAFIRALLSGDAGLDLTIVDLEEDADLRIVASTMVKADEPFTPLWRDHYVLALPDGHPLSLRDSVGIDDLQGAAFVSRQPCDVIDAWAERLDRARIELDVRAVVRNEEYALDLVAAGLGVSVVPSHSCSHRDDIVTREIRDVRLERLVGVAPHPRRALPDGVVEAVARSCRELSWAA
jgi:DNA-binding transcriptional LysR family regulator